MFDTWDTSPALPGTPIFSEPSGGLIVGADKFKSTPCYVLDGKPCQFSIPPVHLQEPTPKQLASLWLTEKHKQPCRSNSLTRATPNAV